MPDEHDDIEPSLPPPSGEIPKAPPIDDLPHGMAAGSLAGYGTRLAGYLIDAVILAIVAVPLGVLLHTAPHVASGAGAGRAHFSLSTGSNLPFVVMNFVYATILIAAWSGQTLGMRIVGVQCVAAADATRVSWGRSIGRAAVFAVLSILVLPGLIDLLWPIWDSKNQTLHDKAAGTVVIKV